MKEGIVCLVRKCLCRKTPEEVVRQALLDILIHRRGFPLPLCGVELSLKTLVDLLKKKEEIGELKTASPRLSSSVLKRRVDVVFFRSKSPSEENRYGLSPFVLFECKASKRQDVNEKQAATDAKISHESHFYEDDPSRSTTADLSHLLQLMGYAHRIGVPYFAIVEGNQVTLYFEGMIFYTGEVENFPSWDDLIRHYDDKKSPRKT